MKIENISVGVNLLLCTKTCKINYLCDNDSSLAHKRVKSTSNLHIYEAVIYYFTLVAKVTSPTLDLETKMINFIMNDKDHKSTQRYFLKCNFKYVEKKISIPYYVYMLQAFRAIF